MKKILPKIYNLLLALIIFLIPTNLFYKFFEEQSYVNGLKVDYLISKIYLSDIFILLFIIITIFGITTKVIKVNKPKISQTTLALLTPVLLIIASQFHTYNPIVSIWYTSKIICLTIFTYLLFKTKDLVNHKVIRNTVLFTLFFQSSVGLYQYFQQRSLFGYLFFGESNLNNYIGVTKAFIFGSERVLPYGTTAHPNVLAGTITVFLLYLLNTAKKQHSSLYFIHAMALITLYLTQSISAFIALIIGSIIIIYRHKTNKIFSFQSILLISTASFIISLVGIHELSLITDNPSFNRRDSLNRAAQNMMNDNRLSGVGLNNFTLKVEEYSSDKEVVRFVQPAHNIFMLLLSETGFLGFISLISVLYLIYMNNKKIDLWWALFLLPIALFDHYLVTLQSGVLLIIFSSMFFNKK